MGKGHIACLISEDGYMTSETNDGLESKGLLRVDVVHRENPNSGVKYVCPKGQVLITEQAYLKGLLPEFSNRVPQRYVMEVLLTK